MQRLTVGVLYAGEMGSAVGRLLSTRGIRVVTTVEERSERTKRSGDEAGIEVLPTLTDVKRVANIVISVVVPTAATNVANAYCSRGSAPADALYLDINSISPATVGRIEDCLTSADIQFVDGAIHGLAAQLESRGTLYLSGGSADRVARLFDGAMRLRVLGDSCGPASSFKMMLGGMSKGLVALFLELGLVARRTEVLDELLTEAGHYYPGVMSAIERLLPTYPRHAARRGDELREVGQTIRATGLEPNMISAAEQIITALGDMDLEAVCDESRHWTVADVLEQVHMRDPLCMSHVY